MHRSLAALLALFLVAAEAGAAGSPGAMSFRVVPPPPVDALSVLVVDMAKGDTLYERSADEPIPPASLTKVMSMMVALDAVSSGRLSLTDRIEILPSDVYLPYRSSMMYLKVGMRVPLDDLLRGMAVASGNDAAMAVARTVAGSVDAFVELMNAEAARLGLSSTRFVEPSGLSELNVTTARDMATLARAYISRFPDSLGSYHSKTSLEFPRADVMPPGEPPPAKRIVLRATNDLLFSYDGCDGLKTGFIDESGFNLIATAERDGTRILSVTLGGVEGPAGRRRSATALLDWAFARWKTVRPAMPTPTPVRVWGGAESAALPAYAEDAAFTVPMALAGGIEARIESATETEAPLAKGAVLGRVVYASGGKVLRRIDLVAPADVPLGNVFVRVKDAVLRFLHRLFS